MKVYILDCVWLALFPGLPRFFALQFSASMYYTERKPKNKKRGRPGNEASVQLLIYEKLSTLAGIYIEAVVFSYDIHVVC